MNVTAPEPLVQQRMVRLHIDIAQDGYGSADAEGVKGLNLSPAYFGDVFTGKLVLLLFSCKVEEQVYANCFLLLNPAYARIPAHTPL